MSTTVAGTIFGIICKPNVWADRCVCPTVGVVCRGEPMCSPFFCYILVSGRHAGLPLRVCGIVYYVLLCAPVCALCSSVLFFSGEHIGSPLRVCGIVHYVLLCAPVCALCSSVLFFLGRHAGLPLRFAVYSFVLLYPRFLCSINIFNPYEKNKKMRNQCSLNRNARVPIKHPVCEKSHSQSA